MRVKSKIKYINLVPVGSNMVLTAYLVKESTKLYQGKASPTFLSVQQVLAIGPRVEDVKVGDWVYIDMQRFVKHVKVKSEIKVGVGGQEMIKEEFIPPAFVAPGDDEAYFKMTDREIEGVIENYAKLPKEMRDYITVSTFEKGQAKILNQAAKDKEAFDIAQAKATKGKVKDIMGPAIIAEGKVRG